MRVNNRLNALSLRLFDVVLLGIILFGCMNNAGFAQKPYFQQDVNYTIKVRLDDINHKLSGYEVFNYRNNSPDTLTKLYIHLWPNAYRDRYTAYFKQKEAYLPYLDQLSSFRGKIDSLDFKVENQRVAWSYLQGHFDIAVLTLPIPLLPGESIRVSTPFRVQLPETKSRMGHSKQQYQITQWYPKPAVYDHKGWHPMPYLDQGEFYSEFGSFDVTIEIPANYVVGATGVLISNPKEEAWLEAREKETRAFLRLDSLKQEKKFFDGTDQVESIVNTPLPVNNPFPPTYPPNEYKSLRFYQDNIHDFAWFADKQYMVLTDYITLTQEGGKTVKIQTLFNYQSRNIWKKSPDYTKKAIQSYSDLVGVYPYEIVTVVEGKLGAGAGMEYPMITVVEANDPESLELVIIHEVGHNWFYGILASNERKHPWMDEGINTYYEDRTMSNLDESDTSKKDRRTTTINLENKLYDFLERQGYVQPLDNEADQFTPVNYGAIVYKKGARYMRFLEQYLTKPVFDKCMKAYYNKWQFKHPYPEDIQAVFEAESGQSLDWFFIDLLRCSNTIDLYLKKVEFTPGLNTVLLQLGVKGCGRLPIPIKAYDADGKDLGTFWTEPIAGETTIPMVFPMGWVKLELNPDQHFFEITQNNNFFYRNKTLAYRRAFKLSFWVNNITASKPHTASWIPFFLVNHQDGFTPGILFNNAVFPVFNGLEIDFAPMFSTKSGRLSGYSNLAYHINVINNRSRLSLRTRTALLADFLRTKNQIRLIHQPVSFNENYTNFFAIQTHHLAYRSAEDGTLRSPNQYRPYYGSIVFQHTHRKRRGELTGLNVEVGAGINNTARLGVCVEKLLVPLSRVTFRTQFFGGFFSENNNNVPYPLQYRLSGSLDPFGEAIFFDDRFTEGQFSGRQLINDQGGFRVLLPWATTNRWISTVNIDATYKLSKHFFWVTLFTDVGSLDVMYTPYLPKDRNAGEQTFFNGGISLILFSNLARINFPLYGAAYHDRWVENWRSLGTQVNFSINVLDFYTNLSKIAGF